MIDLFYLHLSTALAAIPWGTRPVTSKYPDLDLLTNIRKRKIGRERDLNYTETFKIKGIYIWSFATSSGLLLDVWRLFFTDKIMKNP